MKTMNQIGTVAAFTFRDAARKRAFWLTNIILAALILTACALVPRLVSSGGEALSEGNAAQGVGYTCYLLDESGGGAYDGTAELLENLYGFKVVQAQTLGDKAAKALVAEQDNAAFAHVTAGTPAQVTVYAKDMTGNFPVSAVAQAFNTARRGNALAEQGLDPAQATQILLEEAAVETVYLGEQSLGGYILGMAVMLVMFFTIYYFGYGVAMSVATEKSSRVMETLIVSAKPGSILLGKCLGMGALGLLQLLMLLAAGGVGLKFFIPAELVGLVRLPGLTAGKALLLILYFMLGYALFTMLNSVCGSMVSKMEDLNSAMMPASLIAVFSFYGGYITNAAAGAGMGGGSLFRITALIPFTAPFAVPFQLINGSVPPGLLAASVALLLVTIALVSFVSMRVYAASVLHYGGRLKWGAALRLLRK
jgi:ABC-2 type transport system permease protein